MSNSKNKDLILRQALGLFSSRGFENVGVRELTEAASITKPTLYHYFGSKEGLLRELLATNYERLNGALRLATEYTPNPHEYLADVYPVLLRTITAYTEFAQDNEPFYRMVLAMQYLPPTSQTASIAGKYHQEQYAIIEHMFHTMAETHKNMRTKEQIYTWGFIGMINCHIGLWYRGQLSLTPALIERAVNQYMHGIFS